VADVALMTGFAMIIIQQSLTRRPVHHRHGR
jgi:hypothetical protein